MADAPKQRMAELKRELSALGYHPYQIDAVIQDAIGKSAADNPNEQEKKELIAVLERQVRFAGQGQSAQGRGR